jgi:proteasome assembly chaperone (PAC2) family protein
MTAPAISWDGSATFYQTDSAVGLQVAAADSFSGVANVVYSLDGEQIVSVESISPLALSAGIHTLVVTAEDHAGNKTETAITLTALMDVGHLDELIAIGESRGLFANHGAAQSLLSKVKNMQRAIEQGQEQNKVKMFDALVKQIESQSGRLIDAEFAEYLLADLTYIQETGL